MFTPRKILQEPLPTNFTQELLENTFSNEKLIEQLALDFDEYINDNIEKLDVIQDYISNETATDFSYQMLSLLFDPNSGENDLKFGMYSKLTSQNSFQKSINDAYNKFPDDTQPLNLDSKTLRVAKLDDFVKVCATVPCLQDNDIDFQQRAQLALNYIVAYENIFYYIIYPTSISGYDAIGEPQFINIPYIVFDFLEDSSVSLAGQIDIKNFPLIEKPKDWSINECGGYHETVRTKCTKNRGASEQPQRVLDVLNTLQSNKYYIADHANLSDYKTFIQEKQELKLCPSGDMTDDIEMKIELIVRNTTSTFDYLLSFYKGHEDFFFEFQFDFRGRGYSTGYNINLQADKYKKGMIRPHADNFQTDCYFADTQTLKSLKDLHERII